tara:strand:- start:570 stop:851 length:282 start_codon:yes stop_codon:yes gene_type:complete
MNKRKLEIARKKIDKIDNNIFKLVKERTTIVKYMLSLKKYKNQIIDRKRINKILKIIKNKSKKNNVDTRITNRIWKTMIWSYIEYQNRNFKKK